MSKKVFLFFLSFLPTLLYAQQIRIHGKVYNELHHPLEYVTISVLNNENGSITAKDGSFSFNISTTDSITIRFSILGYQKADVFIGKPKNDFKLDVILKQSDKELVPVSINATRQQTNTMEQLKLSGAALLPSSSGGNIEALIATLAGVSSTNELSSLYSVRGGNFDENMVYVSGIEIYRPLLVRSGQQEGLSFINSDMVDKVGFSSGGYGAEYGDKSSSVLDIKYKTPRKFEGAVSGSLLGGSAYVGNKTGKFSQVTSIRYKTNRSLLKSNDTNAEYDPSFMDVQTYITYDLSPKWKASFLGNYAYDSYKFTPKTRDTKFGLLDNPMQYKVYFNGWERDKFVNYHAALSIKGQITDKLRLGFTGKTFSSDERESYDIQGQYRLTDANDELKGIGTYMEHARNKLKSEVYVISHNGSYQTGKHSLKWGLTYQQEKINDRISEWEMRDSSGYSLPNIDDKVRVYWNLKSKNKLNSSRYSAFVQDNFLFDISAGTFIVNAGVRASYWDYNKEFLISPRASVSFLPSSNDQLAFRFATGLYYQSPFYKEILQIHSTDGNNTMELNENIKSQRSIHFVAGNDYYFKASDRPFKLTTEVYYKHLSNINPYTINNVKIRYQGDNIGKGYSMGLDLKLYGELIPGTDSWVSFSLMKTEQKINGKKVPLPNDQRYNLSVYLQDYMPGYDRLTLSVIGYFSQGLPVSAPYKNFDSGYFRSNAYKRVDIGAAWQLLGEDFPSRKKSPILGAFRNIWLGLDVFNLFDMKNVNTYYWISDVHNDQYAVPNYMTERQLNIKLRAEF